MHRQHENVTKKVLTSSYFIHFIEKSKQKKEKN